MRALRLLPVLLLGCGLLTIQVDQDSTTTVEGAGVLGDLLSTLDFTGLDDFDVEIQQQLQDQGVEEGDLESVTLNALVLTASPDLSFLESMDVYVSGDGVPEVLVASGASFPAGQESVSLTMTGANLADAVVAGGMEFRVEVVGTAPADDTEVDIHVGVEVVATAQGACNAAKRQ